MIEPRQMEDPVQCQDLNFDRRRMSEPPGILTGDIGGDGNFARNCVSAIPFEICRKGENICGFVFSPELTIERTHFRVAREQQVHFPKQAGGLARAQDKSLERHEAQSQDFLLHNDQS